MMEGMEIVEECKTAANDLKLIGKHRYIIYKINDQRTQIVIDELGGPEKTFDDFKAAMLSRDCRFAILKFEFDAEGGRHLEKPTLVSWCPEKSPKRILYSSAQHQVVDELNSVCSLHFQWQTKADADYDKMAAEASRKS